MFILSGLFTFFISAKLTRATPLNTMLALVILLSLGGSGLSQLPPMFLGPGMPYENLQPLLFSNILDAEPVVTFVPEYPVYNDNRRYWTDVEPDRSRFHSDDLYQLRRKVDELAHQTNMIHADKARHAEEIDRLREDVKLSLKTTSLLQNTMCAQEQELIRLWRGMKHSREACTLDENVVKELMSVMEKLEKLVDQVVLGFRKVQSKMDTQELA